MKQRIRHTGYPKGLGAPTVDEAEEFKNTMSIYMRGAVETLYQAVMGQQKHQSIAQGYYITVEASDRVRVYFGNNSANWFRREYSTGPAAGNPAYWPPWKPGSRLHAWAIVRGLSPYKVRNTIHSRGTYGDYIITNTVPQYLPKIRRDIGNARRRYIYRALVMRRRESV